MVSGVRVWHNRRIAYLNKSRSWVCSVHNMTIFINNVAKIYYHSNVLLPREHVAQLPLPWLSTYYHQISNIRHLRVQLNCWPLRCSWSIVCRRCSNYIFILDLTPGFNALGKDNCKTRQETFEFGDLVRLVIEIWRYPLVHCHAVEWSLCNSFEDRTTVYFSTVPDLQISCSDLI